MISYFPKMYEDELLYSSIARYALLRDSISFKETVREVFGSDYKTIFELPSHIDNFIKEIAHFNYFNERNIISNHTLFNYFTSFMSLENKEMVKSYMRGVEGNKIYSKIGLLATNVKLTERVKICPKCVNESIKLTGEYFINRHHQIPGVFLCHLHENEVLAYSNSEIRSGNRQEFKLDLSLFDDDYVHGLPRTYKGTLNSKCDNINEEITRRSIIISQNRFDVDLDMVKQILRNRLDELGFLSVKGSINSLGLRKLLKEKFDEGSVNLYGFNVYDVNWLLELLRRNSRRTHPLKYILATVILNIHLENLFASDFKSENDLLPCLNIICPVYNEEIIGEYRITADYKTREKVVTAVCPICGYTYSRKWSQYKNKIGRVKSFGWLWHENLPVVLENNELSLRAKARMMGCDVGTIKKYLNIR